MQKRIALVTVTVFLAAIFGLTMADLIRKPVEISLAERRKLAQAPEFSLKRVLDGSFTADYTAFLKDQIVFRDSFRAIKAVVELGLLQKGENNGVYVVSGNIYDKFYGVNQHYIDRATGLINQIIDSIDSDRVYLSVIPSKAHSLDRDAYLLSDQNAIADDLHRHVNASYIDIMDPIRNSGAELYYRTDHHWTTQGAMRVYEVLITAMGYEPIEDYDLEEVTDSFVGSNYGRAALPWIEKDSIYLAHDRPIDSMSVCRYTTADTCDGFDSVYFREKASGLDPYDIFLGGASPIIVIENRYVHSDRELVLFKDSYSHALAPFLAQHFRKVTLIDLRYVRRELVFQSFDLDGKTVLFLFSTTILNTDPRILN